MYEEINRFLAHEDHPGTFDALFGSTAWRACLLTTGVPGRERCIREAYHSALLASGIKRIRAFKMRNRADRTDYFLFFGTSNLKGLSKMKESMWRADQGGRFDFSDATNPDQTLLFSNAPDFDLLRRQLLGGACCAQTLGVEQIEEFVLTKTPFTASHYQAGFEGARVFIPARSYRAVGQDKYEARNVPAWHRGAIHRGRSRIKDGYSARWRIPLDRYRRAAAGADRGLAAGSGHRCRVHPRAHRPASSRRQAAARLVGADGR